MSRRVYKSFVIGRAFRDGHLGTMAGQVPRRDIEIDRRALDRLVNQKPPPWSADRMLARPIFSTRGAVSDLGLDPAVENDWSQFLQKAVYNSPREHQMRQQVMERLIREDWAPELRKTLFQRAVSLYRNQMNKAIEIVTPDQLLKASADADAEAKKRMADKGRRKDPLPPDKEGRTPQPQGKKAKGRAKDEDTKRDKKGPKTEKPEADSKSTKGSSGQQERSGRDPRGGTFYRRVPHEKGKGYRYYYDPDKYHARSDAHVSGEDMRRKQMGKHITKMLDKAGEGGCSISELKELTKKYGAKEVSAHLHKDCGPGGGAMFANGRFYRRRGASKG